MAMSSRGLRMSPGCPAAPNPDRGQEFGRPGKRCATACVSTHTWSGMRRDAAMAALCSALMPAARAEAEGCLDALAVEGDPELVDAARRELQDGRLAAVDADGCEGVEIRVARDGERVRVRLAR